MGNMVVATSFDDALSLLNFGCGIDVSTPEGKLIQEQLKNLAIYPRTNVSRTRKLELALIRIEKWFGEFPETGKFFDDAKERPVSYGACYGSNGEREYMRGIAREALK
jgi:hypothetical protein